MAKTGKNFQGVDKESAGYKLLASMGWKEGEGLVRRRDRPALIMHCPSHPL